MRDCSGVPVTDEKAASLRRYWRTNMRITVLLLTIWALAGLGCGVMYWGAGLINRYLDRQSPAVIIGGILVIVAMILILNYRYRRLKAIHRAEMSRRSGGGRSPG